jgi:hypothetical protein
MLDYWVARAEGHRLDYPDAGKGYIRVYAENLWLGYLPYRAESDGAHSQYSPSSTWAQGGPLIQRERMLLVPRPDDGWSATTTNSDRGWGDTPLEAAMRCYVASKFGDEVPDDENSAVNI